MLPRFFVFSCMALLGFSSCNKERLASTASLEDALPDGNWKITYFIDSQGQDETMTYTHYDFDFDADGSVLSTPNQSTVNPQTGTWSTSLDPNSQDVNLHIQFINEDRWAYLNGDWDVLEQTDDKVRLQNLNNVNNAVSYLTFEKD